MNNPIESRKHESQRYQLKVLAHFIGVLPLVLLIGDYVRGELGFNPIEAATRRTGRTAVIFLILSLASTPVRRLFSLRIVGFLRKPFGLYAALYAVLHFAAFAIWDFGLDFGLIWAEIRSKPFIIVGAIALLILVVLAATSFRRWQRDWGRKWVKLHRLTYLAGILAIAHYLLAVKGNLLTLEGNYTLPLILAVILIILLVLRLPIVMRVLRGERKGK
ncbi:MAG: protein-methionine-sulfoxide reductase heme-binding subunit MsrQ [Chloroflexota bacterium]|nr:protein-methionine-sulfoxide reductase heme-binding subunit MsrQ [Chloroflexota bacterium]